MMAGGVSNQRHYTEIVSSYLGGLTRLFFQWISQANHIFKRLGVVSKYEDYAVVDSVQVTFYMLNTAEHCAQDVSPRYFFLCPLEDFSRTQNSFALPENLWFWSFDPSGNTRFTGKDAANHGFPPVKVDMEIWLHSWDASVYDALRKVHSAKGFDPDSQEVAIHLGYPLCQLGSEEEETFAYVDEEPQILDQTGCEDTRDIGEIRLNASSTIPEDPVAPSAEMESDNKASGLLNFFRNWETPQFGSLC
ncbi:hypothetical protein FB45DRAFT_34403 [Roridomyces roridus]|uniref:Uncharacterized protein n=1 Tax=Roridomyces roridus TaxID=1738132 RepID=A0AAD7CL46_9AGAR|nr:hypothetical protein FB45DRAFT_34403 [Roridomyces roridus]